MAFRAWCFTVNNPVFDCADLPLHSDEKYVSWQKEHVTVDHVQGYIELSVPRRLANMKKWLPTAHFEKRNGSAVEAQAYTRKAESRIAGPWERGVFSGDNKRGQRSDLETLKLAIKEGATRAQLLEDHSEVYAKYPRFCNEYLKHERELALEKLPFPLVSRFPWQDMLLDMVAEPPHDRQILWVYDPVGNHGKTYMSKYLVDHHRAFYSNGGKAVDLTYAYDGQPIVVFDFVRDAQEYVGYGVIEQLKNGILFSPKYESGLKRFAVPHVIVFANFMATVGKFSNDRLQVIELNSIGQII